MDYLRELQLTELEILNEIHRICTENNLTYFLVGGALLGAVRHKGFIPMIWMSQCRETTITDF